MRAFVRDIRTDETLGRLVRVSVLTPREDVRDDELTVELEGLEVIVRRDVLAVPTEDLREESTLVRPLELEVEDEAGLLVRLDRDEVERLLELVVRGV